MAATAVSTDHTLSQFRITALLRMIGMSIVATTAASPTAAAAALGPPSTPPCPMASWPSLSPWPATTASWPATAC